MQKPLGISFFAMLALSASALAQESEKWAPGNDPYREFVKQLLDETAARFQVGKTTLNDILPDFSIPHLPDLSWDEAVAFAAKEYGKSPVKRIFFLRRYLKKGDPISCVPQLGQTYSGIISGTGSGASVSNDLIAPESEKRAPILAGAPTGPFGMTISYWHAHSSDKLGSDVSLALKEVKIGQLRCSLSFDASNILESFRVTSKSDADNVSVSISSSRSVENDMVFWLSIFSDDSDTTVESREYDQSMTLTKRTVNDGDQFRYSESFVGGYLHERRFSEENDGKISITKRERFPLPNVPALTEMEFNDAIKVLAKDDRKAVATRARAALILQGDSILPQLRSKYETLGEIGQKNIIRVAAGIGSPDAIAFLIERFDDPDWHRIEYTVDRLLPIMPQAKDLVIQSYNDRLSANKKVGYFLHLFGKTGDSAFLPILSKATLDPAQWRSAASALRWNGSEEAKTILKNIAEKAESEEARKYAAQELKSFRLK